MKKELRHYQLEAKEAVFNALKRGVKKQMIVAPGGTGKTLTAADIIRDLGRKLWVNHEESLLEQSLIVLLDEYEILDEKRALDVCEKFGGLIELIKHGKKNALIGDAKIIFDNVGIIKEDLFEINRTIVGASPQTIWKHVEKIPKDWFGATVYDEGDLFGAKTFKIPIDWFEPTLCLSMTATPFRMDNMLMEEIFDEIVYEYPIQQAIKDGYLAEINGILLKSNTNLDTVGTIGGDFNTKQLTVKVNTLERNLLIVNGYIKHCLGQQFICFGADVQHVIDLHEAFQSKGINTAYVVSDKERMVFGTDRKEIVRKYRKGELVGLVNHNIFSAGFDHKDCGCVIAACPTKSKRKFLQQIFRCTRLKTKSFVEKFGQVGTILDVMDMTTKHLLINTKTLDQGLEIEDRIFVSRKNKDLLLEARKEREVELTLRNKDEKIVPAEVIN